MIAKIATAFLGTLLFASVSSAHEAVVNCSIEYVSPNGATTVSIVNQNYEIPLQPGVQYVQPVLLGDRRLDVSAYNERHGLGMVSFTLWESVTGGYTLCSETKTMQGVADCEFRSRSTKEYARVACTRIH